MVGVVLAEQIGVGVDPSPAQRAVAFGLLALIVYQMVRWYYSARTAGTDAEQRRQLRAIDGQLEAVNPTSGYVTYKNSVDEWRAFLNQLFRGEEADASVRSAVRKTAQIPVDAMPAAPSLVVRLAYESVLYALLGAVALFGIDRWTTVLNNPFTLPNLGGTSNVSAELIAAWQFLADAITAFPFWELLYASVLIVVLEGGKWMYQHWIVVSGVLAVAAITTYLLGEELGDKSIETSTPIPFRFLAGNLIGVSAIVLTLGTALNTAASAFTASVYADIGVFVVSVLAGGFLSRNVMRESWRRTRETVSTLVDTPDHRELLGMYVIARLVSIALGVVALPVMAAYAVTVIQTGKASTLAGVVLAAPTATKAILAIIAGMVLIAALVRAAGAVQEAGQAWRRAIGRRVLKLLLIGGAVPALLGILVGLVVLYAVGDSAIAVVVALTAVVVFRVGYYQLRKAKYGLAQLEFGNSAPARAYCQAYTLRDADDNPIYVVDITGADIYAHRDRGALVETVCTDVLDPMFEDGTPRPTVEENYWESVRNGLVDWQQHGIDKTRERVSERIRASLARNNRRMHIEELRSVTDYWPETVFESELNRLIDHNKVGLKRGGDIVVLVE